MNQHQPKMGSAMTDESTNESKASSDSEFLKINSEDWEPFRVDENTCIEAEVRLAIDEFIKMLKLYIYRGFILIAYCVCSVTFMGCLFYISDSFYMTTSRVPLQDRLHEFFDKFNYKVSKTLCDGLLHTFFSMAVARVALFTPQFYTLQVALRMSFLITTGQLIRGIFVVLTTLPAVESTCDPRLDEVTILNLVPRIYKGMAGRVDNCTDIIISGHTIYCAFSCVMLFENTRNIGVKILSVVLTIIILLTVIASRYHYTIDVIFGLLVVGMLHYFYYSKLDDYGVYLYNKIYHSKSKTFKESRRTLAHGNFLTRFLGKLELLEERMVLGQKMRTLYLAVNSQKDMIDAKLLRTFNRCVYLFGADESGDIVTLYRGSGRLNFYYWKSLYNIIFKRKTNVVSL